MRCVRSDCRRLQPTVGADESSVLEPLFLDELGCGSLQEHAAADRRERVKQVPMLPQWLCDPDPLV